MKNVNEGWHEQIIHAFSKYMKKKMKKKIRKKEKIDINRYFYILFKISILFLIVRVGGILYNNKIIISGWITKFRFVLKTLTNL